MPLTTLAAQITPTGISAPTYADILQSLQETFLGIFGADAYISADSQDGQLLAAFALAQSDVNQACIATYNAFSPTYAQGAGLSSVVKINGIRRLYPTFSTAVGSVVGQAGTIITNGVVEDANGNLWNLPGSVTIPGGGSITVTVTAQEAGNFVAPSGTINKINTPTRGWQTFASTADAIPGAPVESDATLRQRQARSTGLPALTPVDAMYAALANLIGVGRLAVYENPTGVVDANGLPAHSISVVIQGGDATAIATTIGQRKTPGAATYGSTSTTYTDPITGIAYMINYYVLSNQTIKVAVTGTAKAGYNSLIAGEIKQAVADYINSLLIGQDVEYLRMVSPAYLNRAVDGNTYEITALTTALGADPPDVIDIPIAFNQAAICDAAVDVTVTIT